MSSSIRSLMLAVTLGWAVVPSVASAAPAPKAWSGPVEAEGLRLEIRSRGKLGTGPTVKREDMEVTLVLINRSKEVRSVKQLVARGNRLDDARE